MIVDLTKESGTSNQVVYLTEAGLSSGAYGSVETNPVNGVESIIWTGVTNDASYMTTKLVLRRVPAGTFMMGEDAGAKSVTLTKDFYIGVFEMTQEQWYRINSSWPSCYFTNSVEKNMRPVEYESSYHAIRGSNVGTNWPGSAGVDNNSIIGKLRSKTKIVTFDLPTEAQWEYACRAGTITYYNDGLGTPANTSSNAQMDVLGRYRYNGGYINGAEPSRNVGVTNGTAAVGGYRPNAWGLYDMHGNLWEWCLDWSSSLQGGTDPAGGVTGTARVLRGGSWNASSGTVCRSAFRNGTDPTSQNIGFGFRLVVTLP